MRALHAVVAVLLVLAGCLGSAPVSDSSPNPTETPNDTTSGTESPTSGATATCEETTAPSFYGVNEPEIGLWERDVVSVGLTVGGNRSVFLVAFVDGERRGVRQVTTHEHAVSYDGITVELDRRLSGEHTVEIVVSEDGEAGASDDDGSYDPSVDRRCADTTTGERTVDFDRFDGNDST